MTNPYSNKGLYKKRRVNLSDVPDSAESDSFLSVLDNDYFIVLAPYVTHKYAVLGRTKG